MDVMLVPNQGGRMPTPLRLRTLTPAELRRLRAKIKDLSLSARIPQRYRVIAEVRLGRCIGGGDGAAAARVLSPAPPTAAGDGRRGAPAVAARGPLGATHSDLEDLGGPGL